MQRRPSVSISFLVIIATVLGIPEVLIEDRQDVFQTFPPVPYRYQVRFMGWIRWILVLRGIYQ